MTNKCISVQDIVNSVKVVENPPNTVIVQSTTFLGGSSDTSGLLYGIGVPSAEIGTFGDFFIDVQGGVIWGPKGATVWPGSPLEIVPRRYVHIQNASATTWNISHDLDGFPSVTIVDSGGSVVIGSITYNSSSSITVSFSAPFSGVAYLT